MTSYTISISNVNYTLSNATLTNSSITNLYASNVTYTNISSSFINFGTVKTTSSSLGTCTLNNVTFSQLSIARSPFTAFSNTAITLSFSNLSAGLYNVGQYCTITNFSTTTASSGPIVMSKTNYTLYTGTNIFANICSFRSISCTNLNITSSLATNAMTGTTLKSDFYNSVVNQTITNLSVSTAIFAANFSGSEVIFFNVKNQTATSANSLIVSNTLNNSSFTHFTSTSYLSYTNMSITNYTGSQITTSGTLSGTNMSGTTFILTNLTTSNFSGNYLSCTRYTGNNVSSSLFINESSVPLRVLTLNEGVDIQGRIVRNNGEFCYIWNPVYCFGSRNFDIGGNNLLVEYGGDTNEAGVFKQGVAGTYSFNVIASGRIAVNNEMDFLSSKKVKNLKSLIDDDIVEKLIVKFKRIPFFKYKLKDDENNKEYYGLIAEELEKIFPHLIINMNDYVPNVLKICKVELLDNKYIINHIQISKLGYKNIIKIHQNKNFIYLDYIQRDNYIELININELDISNEFLVYGSLENCPNVNKNDLFEIDCIIKKYLIKKIENLKLQYNEIKTNLENQIQTIKTIKTF